MFDEPHSRHEPGWTVAVALLAAGYFWLGIGSSVEWIEAGQIIYPSWQVARGALPYRDFLQLYGPSEFFLHGALLGVFGADLWTVLAALVLVKVAVVTLAYVGARSVAARPCAFAATALLIAIWGAPVWVFDTPYANHYSTALILAGVVAVATAPRRWLLTTCAAAGICFGIAATFKQTTGLVACVGIGLAVVARSGAWADAEQSAPGDGRGTLVRALRLIFLAAVALFVVSYLAAASSPVNACVLAAPVGVGIGGLSVAEIRGGGDPAARRRGLIGLAALGSGAALPILAYAVYFAHRGALRELAFSTISGLPRLIHWFTPLTGPPADALVPTLAFVGGLALTARRKTGPGWSTGVVLAGGAASAVAVMEIIGNGIIVVRPLLTLLLFGSVWGGLAALWVDVRRGRWNVAADRLATFAFTAAAAVLLLYPAGDLPHVLMAWPFFVPVSAHVLWRWHRAASVGVARGRRLALAMLVAAGFAALCVPLTSLLLRRLTDAPAGLALARARGVTVADPRSAPAASVIDYLAGQPDGPILALSNEQMLYFLSGRDSIVAPYEFILYLVGAGAIHDDDAHRILDDAGLAAQVEAQRPLVIDRSVPTTQRLRHTYPQVARILDAHYAPVYRADTYTVLAWKD